ncbi:MAG: lysophospholipid acyltransferase family protein [Planctomycetota bacterium]|nr:lysophospholipid acyltransferase family protein [Planctomycetota bacterium]
MSLTTTLFAAGLWVAWACLVRWLCRNPRGDLLTGVYYHVARVYALLFHRLGRPGAIRGLEHVPREHPGGLIVIANHTAGVDPMLVQACLAWEPRWMMARDMMVPGLNWFWQWSGVIAVDRTGRDSASAREGIRHLRASKPLGIFPEGKIERPAGVLLPVLPGVGFIIAKTRAAVLPVVIRGTPDVDPAWRSLWIPSRSSIEFLPIVRFPPEATPDQIVREIEAIYDRATGWPRRERAQTPAQPPAQTSGQAARRAPKR